MNANRLIHTMEDVSPNSLWITATPSTTILSLPFYIMEAGHFLAPATYAIQREQHDSFLLIYTIKGCGYLQSSGISLELAPESCVIIDCHTPHAYGSNSELWDFLWIHFEGNGVASMINLLYSTGLHAIQMNQPLNFQQQLMQLLHLTNQNDVLSCMEASSKIHLLFHNLLQASLGYVRQSEQVPLDNNIRQAIDYIQTHYSEALTIEDMIQDIPLSKYHFIRCFRRIMGMTPYSYLTNYRINMSKIFLRSTTDSIATIAERCGFLDASNFIAHFKKQTGVRPTQYRKDFNNNPAQ